MGPRLKIKPGDLIGVPKQSMTRQQVQRQIIPNVRGGGLAEEQRPERETLARNGGALNWEQVKAANEGYHGDVYKLPDAKDKTWTWQQAEEGMKRFNGNVDLYNRPVVSADAMAKAGYNIPVGNTATVYSMQRGIKDKDGKVREVLYTPIAANGEVMSQKDIDAYIDSLDGSDDILAADKAGRGMIIHLDADPSGNDGQELHLMQEAYGKKPKVMPMAGANDVDEDADDGRTIANTTAQDAPKVDSYGKMLEFLKGRQQVDADADKRAKRREMMAAIGDGISALSSLYQTTKGAPVTYTPGHDMSEVMRQRYDRYIAQRKADEDKYLNYLKVQHVAEQDKESQEYRRQMAEYRQQQIEEAERTHKANEELKREQLEAKKTAEENIKAYRQARLDMMRAKDPGTVEFFKAKAEALANGWPENEANEAGQIAQEKYNEAKKETDRQKKLADKKAIKAAPNPPKQGRGKTPSNSSSKKKPKKPLGTNPQGL